MERVFIDSRQVTDEWFDGTHPNPLHPIGTRDKPIIIDPVKRVVEYHTSRGIVLAKVGDVIVTTTYLIRKGEG